MPTEPPEAQGAGAPRPSSQNPLGELAAVARKLGASRCPQCGKEMPASRGDWKYARRAKILFACGTVVLVAGFVLGGISKSVPQNADSETQIWYFSFRVLMWVSMTLALPLWGWGAASPRFRKVKCRFCGFTYRIYSRGRSVAHALADMHQDMAEGWWHKD